MLEDDSFAIATVPRYGNFGTQGTDDDADSTLGDRFFDMLHLQTKSVTKTGSRCNMMVGDVRSPEVEETERVPAKVSSEDIQEAPFELNRLAMFRPPSRTRLSARRSNTASQEEKECFVELSSDGNVHQNGNASKADGKKFAGNLKSGHDPAKKTMPTNNYRVISPGRFRQRSLSREQLQRHPVDLKPKMGQAPRRQVITTRAASGEPGIRRSVNCSIRTNGTLTGGGTKEDSLHTFSKGPIRVRSASTDTTAPRRNGNLANVVRTTSNKGNFPLRTVTNVLNMANGTAAVAKKSPYMGPETRARARMKQSNQIRGLSDIISNNWNKTTPQRGVSGKFAADRPSQLNLNVPVNSKIIAKNNDPLTTNDKVAGSTHISRSRVRTNYGPIRVQNTQLGTATNRDELPPVESESRFRQSVTRRPKGGDSMEREIPQEVGKENNHPQQRSEVAATKPRNLEFAPCLRSRAAAKKTQSAAGSGVCAPSVHSTVLSSKGRPIKDGKDAPTRRRTAAEREAFFRRLSTPKTIVTIKKCCK